VNAAIVDPGFITNVCKKLDLDQREAAEIFGGGINAFSRYKNGRTRPPLAWSSCSSCWTVTPICSTRSEPPDRDAGATGRHRVRDAVDIRGR